MTYTPSDERPSEIDVSEGPDRVEAPGQARLFDPGHVAGVLPAWEWWGWCWRCRHELRVLETGPGRCPTCRVALEHVELRNELAVELARLAHPAGRAR